MRDSNCRKCEKADFEDVRVETNAMVVGKERVNGVRIRL